METLLDYYAKIDSPEFEGKTKNDVLGLLPHPDSDHPDYNTAAREWMAFMIRKSFDYKDDPAQGTVSGCYHGGLLAKSKMRPEKK